MLNPALTVYYNRERERERERERGRKEEGKKKYSTIFAIIDVSSI
jgi:hypothetical protein